jgi:hypothetical protein
MQCTAARGMPPDDRREAGESDRPVSVGVWLGLGPSETSIRGVRFEGGDVVIDVRRSATRSGVVRVSLPDGSLVEQ